MITDLDRAAVLRLFEDHFDRVYRFVRRSTDPATAEEVAQDVFIKLLSRGNLEKKPISVSYLIKVADNMLKRRHRNGQRARLFREKLARGLPGAVAPPEAPEQAHGDVLDAFGRLSREEQEAVRLIVCEGLSYRDAAASMGVRVSTINNWKHRGIQRLKEHTAANESAGRRGPGDSHRGLRGKGSGAGRAAARDN